MLIGDNIKEIREVEKNLKRSFVASKLNISTRAYANIENNLTDITVNRLQDIATIFECSTDYILHYKKSKNEFYNYFHNNNGNKGVNIMHQGDASNNNNEKERLYELQQKLLESEQKRIQLLEQILKANNIDF